MIYISSDIATVGLRTKTDFIAMELTSMKDCIYMRYKAFEEIQSTDIYRGTPENCEKVLHFVTNQLENLQKGRITVEDAIR